MKNLEYHGAVTSIHGCVEMIEMRGLRGFFTLPFGVSLDHDSDGNAILVSDEGVECDLTIERLGELDGIATAQICGDSDG